MAAREQVDASLLRHVFERLFQNDVVNRGQHAGGTLVVHQDNVDPGFQQPVHPFLNHAVKFKAVGVAHRAVRADLPDHQLRMDRDDIGVETGQFLGRILPANAAVDDGEMRGR